MRPMRCIFSVLAESDLEEIGDYIARDNPERAVSFIQEIRVGAAKSPPPRKLHRYALNWAKGCVWFPLAVT